VEVKGRLHADAPLTSEFAKVPAVYYRALTEAEVESYRLLNVQTPCRVVPNGIDVSKYRDAPVRARTSRWDFRPEQQVILFLGRVHPIKGADKLLEAFLKVQAEFPNAVLVLGGPDEFGLEEKFRSVAEREGLGDRILFPGMVSGEDKLDLLARADLFSLPSDAEGFSMAVLESLASGTPVLLSPGCHFPQVEKAGVGRVVPAEPDALAAALRELLGNPQELADMGRLSRPFVSTYYNWDAVTDQLVDAYREGIHRHKALWGQ
jgi:glycosyltransferase involved in cell wall biosynthesis